MSIFDVFRRKADGPRMKFGFRGENIVYSLPDKEIELEYTWINGPRVYTESIDKWRDGSAMTEDEKRKVFRDAVHFVKRKDKQAIIVINSDDPSKELWEELSSLNQSQVFPLAGPAAVDGLYGCRPEQPNGRTVVLLHGKNFCAATWEAHQPLSNAGYRVIAPDQIGFCKSTKPQAYQFSLHQLAANTRALLDSLGVEKAIVMGHSMGGMLATRYALIYPARRRRWCWSTRSGWRTGRPRACRSDRRPMVRAELQTSFDRISIISRRPITAATGSPNTTAGWRCWPACTGAKAGSWWPGIRR